MGNYNNFCFLVLTFLLAPIVTDQNYFIPHLGIIMVVKSNFEAILNLLRYP